MLGEVSGIGSELLQQRGLSANRLSPVVERSWERCFQSGIDSRDDRLFQSLPGTAQVRRINDEYRDFIGMALPEMEELLKAMSDANWCVLCTNTSGMIVKAVAANRSLPPPLQVIMVPGKGLSEAEIGTTAPGCALIDRAPVRVDRREHFLDATGDFICAAAPFFDAQGELVGVIDLSGVGVRGHAEILEMVALAAQAIENRIVLHSEGDVRLRFHYRADMLSSPRTALISFSSDGRVMGANSVGRRLLSLDEGVSGHAAFEQLFEGAFGSLVDLSLKGDGRGILRTMAGERVSVATEARLVRSHARQVPARSPKSLNRPPERFVGTDRRHTHALDHARRVYAHDVPVLVQGETGTGKEAFARSTHEASARKSGPFVAVDCSAIPANLIEAELFGYEDGAFTGSRRGGAKGKIEAADKGTLFLDEIGDMPLDLQTRLLRVLQEKAVTRVGSTRSVPVDFGLISATHRGIEQMVRQKTFRQDLFFRLKGLTVTLTPLRERSDLKALLTYFLQRAGSGTREWSLSDAAWRLLSRHPWPGNIRELEQVIAVACALSDDGVITADHLPIEILAESVEPRKKCADSSGERDHETVRRALEENDYNVSAASRSLGIARTTLYRRLNKRDS